MAREHCLLKSPSRESAAFRFFLGAAGMLAFCSLAYELLLAKMVAEITGQAALWESVTMGAFLLGLGLRSLVFKPGEDLSLLRQLLVTERRVIAASMLSVIWIFFAEILYRIYLYDDGLLRELWPFPPVMVLGAVAQLGPLAVGWLSGYELQFFIYFREGRFFKRQTAKVLAVYHFGGLIATGFFLIGLSQSWSPSRMLIGVIGLSLIVLTALVSCARNFAPDLRISDFRASCLGLVGSFAAFCFLLNPLEKLGQKNFYFNHMNWRYSDHGVKDIQHPFGPLDLLSKASGWPEVKRLRTPYQVVDIVESQFAPQSPEDPQGTLHINGRFQIDSRTAPIYHETMVHIPLGMAPAPIHKVLVLGGGDGAIVRELRKYEFSLGQVVLVDIDPVVVELARSEPFLTKINDHAFSWHLLETHVGDALAFMRQDFRFYDAIFLDLTYPYEFDSSRFYSREFFRLLQRRLAPNGFFVLGSPVNLLSGKNQGFSEMLIATSVAAGFHFHLGIKGRRDNFFVAGKAPFSAACVIPASIALKALERGPHRGWEVQSLTGKLSPGTINSVMRPHALEARDGFY